ncbi:hypothetical protein PIB30_049363 [Stylosanthes scabra]|uniref:Uncharacterized protein n=1 Tax=Stylosanthes scabra TaxID=79078 RepID=A0ABU6TJ92_9FABA|nr:hypothetical protein [Stylosanthes scabra]
MASPLNATLFYTVQEPVTTQNWLFFGCSFFKVSNLIGFRFPKLVKVGQTLVLGSFMQQASMPYCSFFVWLDKHCAKLGVVNPVKDGELADVVNDHFAVIKVENRVALLENRVEAMEKIRNVNGWFAVATVIAMLAASLCVPALAADIVSFDGPPEAGSSCGMAGSGLVGGGLFLVGALLTGSLGLNLRLVVEVTLDGEGALRGGFELLCPCELA